MAENWGWSGSVAEFLGTSLESWINSLKTHHRQLLVMDPSQSQLDAWVDEHSTMSSALRECLCVNPELVSGWWLVFEYELPLEGGRRPDVVVMAGSRLIVLEFKSTPSYSQADIDQTLAYVRDLKDYHRASHELSSSALLVLQSAPAGYAKQLDDLLVIAPDSLGRYLYDRYLPGGVAIQEWLESDYEPLPSLVEAARRIFRDEPLPHVRAALSAGIPATVELLGEIADNALASGTRALAFVTGVPGAGKTLVGLRLVYERSEKFGRATFLSGNGPLVAVLQDALDSKVFVRDLHQYIKTYALNSKAKTPAEHVVVFDEAQRAWDSAYMKFKEKGDRSEPDLLMDIGSRIADWALLVGLVGEGQEIHSGEESGIAQWSEAIRTIDRGEKWVVHCPPGIAPEFEGHHVEMHEELQLDSSLRSRRAQDHHEWVRLLLEGSPALAARKTSQMNASSFPVYVTRDLDEARCFARDRIAGNPYKRTGLLASSHAKKLIQFGIDNGFQATKRIKYGTWYNDTLESEGSSNALIQPVTEFGCQGLELDIPVICWGEDYRWDDNRWELTPIRRRYPQDDPEILLRNVYRVLLTRARDGIVIYVPPLTLLDATELVLLAAGARVLPQPEMVTAAS